MALPVNGSTHLISALLLIYRPRKDERLSWLAYGLPTLVVTHQLQVEHRTGKVCQSETDVLPLCHATNQVLCSVLVYLNFIAYTIAMVVSYAQL